jgi:hypothetical protein
MLIVTMDSSGPSLHAAIFQYFQWLSSSSAAETASTASASSSLGSDNEDENGDKSEENVLRDPPTHLNHMGNNVLATLMEESPVELEKIASAAEPIALAPWVPDLKVQFDTYDVPLSQEQPRVYGELLGLLGAMTESFHDRSTSDCH